MKPLYDYVLVEQETKEEITAGGIVVPQTSEKSISCATIVAIGTGRLVNDGSLAPLSVKVGDIIYYKSYMGIKFEDKILLKESEILGIK